MEFEPEKSGEPDKFAPIDLLDYIYAVLHCPAYREKYREFLRPTFRVYHILKIPDSSTALHKQVPNCVGCI